MTRSYGQLGRRKGSAAWQWILMGIIVTSLCWVVIIFALLVLGVLTLPGVEVAALPTGNPTDSGPTPDIDATIAAAIAGTATASFTEQPPTPTVDTAAQGVDAQAASTDTGNGQTNNTNVQVASSPTPTPTEEPTATVAVPANNPIPESLASIISPLLPVEGTTFSMGTTPNEVLQAVNECVDRDAGACVVDYGRDSYPAHQVRLDSYQIEANEVTFAQYVAFLNSPLMGPNSHKTGCGGFACIETANEDPDRAVITFDSANYAVPEISQNYPVYGVTWYGAKAYCQAINRRLPTEAEWELAARGTDGRIYPWGNQWSESLAKTGRPVDAPQGPVPVRSFTLATSPYGAYDMAGNVAEWVADNYSGTYYDEQAALPQPVYDPIGPLQGTEKVVRGGAWPDVPFFSRSVHRQSWRPDEGQPWIGFRCAADASTLTPGTDANSGVNPATLGVDASNPADEENGVPTIEPPPERQTPVGTNGG